MAKKKKIKKKEKHYIGVKEFIFNFVSLVFMIGVGLYFGYRSLYYYSRQNKKLQAEAQTLNGYILQNTPVVSLEEDGLHHDSIGYYFKGAVNNNYVMFDGRIYRVIRINEDNTVRVVSEDYAAIFPWGNQSEYRGSNVYQWLDKTDWEHSGTYYKTLTNPEQYLLKTSYQIDVMTGDKVSPLDEICSGNVTLLTATDYILAGGKRSFLNTGKSFFLLGITEDKENIYVDTDGSIQHCDSTEGYGIRPVLTFKGNTVISSGTGTLVDPYVVYQEKKNYIHSYVKLGDDIWRVFAQGETSLRLSYNGYAKINGQEIAVPYSQTTSFYDIINGSNIGHYLNTTYLASLPYQNFLLPFDSYVGEISDDKGYQYSNIYNVAVNAKVGLLNVFDYMTNTDLEDYFRVNTISEVGSMQYNTTAKGRLIESDVKEWKHVVPVVSISIDQIKGGTGTVMDPYIMG